MPETSWARRMADSLIRADSMGIANPELKHGWEAYPIGVVLKGIEAVWRDTGESRYFEYIRTLTDTMVSDSGVIPGYPPGIYNLDHINNGKILLTLYRETGERKYATAAEFLMTRLSGHPRTSEGGFWHKSVYPSQMWLDGIYMASPFIAEYGALFGGSDAFDEAVRQIDLMNRHAGDPETGLLYHGWDESRRQTWADPVTGCSPNFWGRAMGWYVMAMADVMEWLPVGAGRDAVASIFQAAAGALLRVQDGKSGLWYQVLDGGEREGNYLEASVSAMLAYAFLKACRLGFAPSGLKEAGMRAFAGLNDRLVTEDSDGFLHLVDTCRVAGLGSYDSSCPYRDGSFSYYVSEPRQTDDLKGLGPYILAASEAGKA